MNYLPLFDLALKVEFRESGFRYFVLVIIPSNRILLFIVTNCSGNFNRILRFTIQRRGIIKIVLSTTYLTVLQFKPQDKSLNIKIAHPVILFD